MGIKHLLFSIRCQVQDIKHKISSIEYQVSYIKNRISSIRYQVSDIKYQISSIRYQVSYIKYHISNISYPVLDIKYYFNLTRSYYFETFLLVTHLLTYLLTTLTSPRGAFAPKKMKYIALLPIGVYSPQLARIGTFHFFPRL